MSTFAKGATVIGLLMFALALAGAGMVVGLVPVGRITGDRISPVVENWLDGQMDGGSSFAVKCDDTWKQKGRISDCLATRGNGVRGQVLIEQIDLRGHFTMQVADQELLRPEPVASPSPSPSPTTSYSNVTLACMNAGGDPSQCGCIQRAIDSGGSDGDTLRAVDSYRRYGRLPDDLAALADSCRNGA